MEEEAEYFAKLFGGVDPDENLREAMKNFMIHASAISLRILLGMMNEESAINMRECILKSWKDSYIDGIKQNIDQMKKMSQTNIGMFFKGSMPDPDKTLRDAEATAEEVVITMRQMLTIDSATREETGTLFDKGF